MATTYVTLVGFGGTPVRLADQTGAPYPTTGNGALVFANGATLTNVQITGQIIPTPTQLGPGTLANPALAFGTFDRGIYSKGAGDISIAANGNSYVSFELATTSFTFTNSSWLNLFSNVSGEAGIQSTNSSAGTGTLALNKFGGSVTVTSGVALVAGGSVTSSNVVLGTSGPGLYAGTGAPTISAVQGSLYMRADVTQAPYYNSATGTTWVQLADISSAQTFTNKTLTSPTINGGTITGATISGGTITFGAIVGTSSSSNALTTGQAGTTNPIFNVDNSTALAVAGINIKGAASGGTVAVATTDSGAASNLTINAKGTGTISIAGTSTGATTVGHNLTLSSTLTYGGVTLTAGVTGTGNMVADGSGGTGPTLTNPVVGTQTANDNSTKAASTAYADRIATNLKINVQVFVASGTYTPSANLIYCTIECWGAGGGGGGTASAAASSGAQGGGGGAGSYSSKFATASTIGVSQVVTVGSAGSAGTAGNNAGGAGGDVSVGSICIGKGGAGGAGNSGAASNVSAGGLGGVAGTGDLTSTGMPGGSTVTIVAGGASVAFGGAGFGGSTLVGGGGRAIFTATAAAGEAGTGHGSGGSGGASWSASGTAAGGAGTVGYVRITEYCSH